MAEAEDKANVCTFTFKKRKGAAMRRKVKDEDEGKSSSEDETVVTRAEKKESAGVLTAKTVILIFHISSLENVPHLTKTMCVVFSSGPVKRHERR